MRRLYELKDPFQSETFAFARPVLAYGQPENQSAEISTSTDASVDLAAALPTAMLFMKQLPALDISGIAARTWAWILRMAKCFNPRVIAHTAVLRRMR
jgi:hypothetical protein